MEIQFSNKGIPLMMASTKVFAQTTGSPLVDQKKEINKTVNTSTDQNFETVEGNIKLLSWGSSNNFPQWADGIISSTSVLNSGLKFIRNFTLGQGVFACKVVGYDEDGNEILEAYPDKTAQELVDHPRIRRYLEKAARDYFKFGSCCVQLIPDLKGEKIIGLNPINAFFTRLSERDIKTGEEKCVVSGKFPDTPSKDEFEVYDVLLDYDPMLDLEIRKFNKKKIEKVVVAVRDSWSNKDTYSEPVWMSAYAAGWVDIAKSVPAYLKKVFKNQATWKWHIQIPYSFWDKKFPESLYSDVKKREDAINDFMDDIETNLLGNENAEKPLFTHYALNDLNGKIEEEWKITPLDNKSKEGDKLVTSAAANSEILFALMINPNVLGAGMPGGTYAGNQGGSNIREAFLVNIANAWVDRQNLLDPVQLMLRYNGYEDISLRFRNTVLTTLDKGSGTQKKLS